MAGQSIEQDARIYNRAMRQQLNANMKRLLPKLIWRCPCGEVNVRSHEFCRLCGESQDSEVPLQSAESATRVPPVFAPPMQGLT